MRSANSPARGVSHRKISTARVIGSNLGSILRTVHPRMRQDCADLVTAAALARRAAAVLGGGRC
jgi:hypothetical protein